MSEGLKQALKMWFRLALVIAATFVALESALVIAIVERGKVPKEPASFWGSPIEWTTVTLNILAGAAITGAAVSTFLVLSLWKWPRKLDRWLTSFRIRI